MDGTSDEGALVRACVAGDRAAWRELFRRERQRVHATLYRVLGTNREIEDLLQETFLEVFRSLPRFRGESQLKTWIDRIAVRVALRHLAARRVTPAATALESVPEARAEGGAPDDRAHAREGLRRLVQALEALTPAQRVVLALHAFDGRPLAQVARLMGTTTITARVRLFRARRVLDRHAADDPILGEYLRRTRGETP
jgi:RNA polymerase sigma-70 factor (ECF subfamily)